MSATRESNEFSITIRTGEADGVAKYEAKLLEALESICSHYCVAYEQKGDLSTQHFQMAVVTTARKRSDNLKATLVELLGEAWTPEQKKYAIAVKKNREGNDIKLIAGGYCCKQDDNPIIKGWTIDELQPYRSQYDDLKRKSEIRNLSKDSFLEYIVKVYYEIRDNKDPDVREKFQRLDERTKLKYTYKVAISQGADLQRYSTPIWRNYLVDNFGPIFEGQGEEYLCQLISMEHV